MSCLGVGVLDGLAATDHSVCPLFCPALSVMALPSGLLLRRNLSLGLSSLASSTYYSWNPLLSVVTAVASHCPARRHVPAQSFNCKMSWTLDMLTEFMCG